MALTVKFDPKQLQALITVIEQGFTDIVETLSGEKDEETQARINQLAGTVKTVKDKLQSSVDSQTKGD